MRNVGMFQAKTQLGALPDEAGTGADVPDHPSRRGDRVPGAGA